MKIGLIGYGKMGKEIEKIAIERGHDIPVIIDLNNLTEFTPENISMCDVVIEFTIPESAVQNYLTCFKAGVPVVSGTTGWMHQREFVYEKCKQVDGTFFHTTNFSVGVNLFFELNRRLASLMVKHSRYKPSMHEIHHIHKLDAPSGTALTLAEDLVQILPDIEGWALSPAEDFKQVPIVSERTGEVPGTHIVTYSSEVDTIEISHAAHNRKGFALGAVLAAEFSLTNKGILTMKDLLKF